MSEETAETTTYKGGCHCGAVSYSVTLPPVEKVFECNCSICSTTGWRLVFTPKSNFELHQGADALSDYQFNKKNIHHRFCKTCGIRSFADGPGHDGTEWVSINTRCLKGFDGADLPVEKFDGASL